MAEIGDISTSWRRVVIGIVQNAIFGSAGTVDTCCRQLQKCIHFDVRCAEKRRLGELIVQAHKSEREKAQNS